MEQKGGSVPPRGERVSGIVDAAERVFLRVDFPQASMSEIASEAGISRPTLYKYFPSIDDLAFAVEMRALDAIYESIEEGLKRTGKGLSALEFLLRGLVANFEANRAHLRFTGLFDHYYHEGYPDPGLADRYSSYLGRFDQVEAIIERGKGDGSIRPDIDSHNAAYMVGNALLPMMQRMASRGKILEAEQRVELSRQFDEFIAMVLGYAAGPPPKREARTGKKESGRSKA